MAFLRYEGLTVDRWRNLLKPETAAARELAIALVAYANPRPDAVDQAAIAARRGLAWWV